MGTMKQDITEEQLNALKELKKLMLKHDLRFLSDDRYCGVEVRIGKNFYFSADFKTIDDLLISKE